MTRMKGATANSSDPCLTDYGEVNALRVQRSPFRAACLQVWNTASCCCCCHAGPTWLRWEWMGDGCGVVGRDVVGEQDVREGCICLERLTLALLLLIGHALHVR